MPKARKKTAKEAKTTSKGVASGIVQTQVVAHHAGQPLQLQQGTSLHEVVQHQGDVIQEIQEHHIVVSFV